MERIYKQKMGWQFLNRLDFAGVQVRSIINTMYPRSSTYMMVGGKTGHSVHYSRPQGPL